MTGQKLKGIHNVQSFSFIDKRRGEVILFHCCTRNLHTLSLKLSHTCSFFDPVCDFRMVANKPFPARNSLTQFL
jgi:hypothetical protein